MAPSCSPTCRPWPCHRPQPTMCRPRRAPNIAASNLAGRILARLRRSMVPVSIAALVAALDRNGAALDRNTAALVVAIQKETTLTDELTQLTAAVTAEGAPPAAPRPAPPAPVGHPRTPPGGRASTRPTALPPHG